MAAALLHLLTTVMLAVFALRCEGKMDWEQWMDKIDKQLKEHVNSCRTEMNVDLSECYEQFKKKSDAAPENCRCFAACVGKKAGVIDENGFIVKGKLEEKIEGIEDEKIKQCAKKLYEECKTAPMGEGGCTDANDLIICFAFQAKKRLGLKGPRGSELGNMASFASAGGSRRMSRRPGNTRKHPTAPEGARSGANTRRAVSGSSRHLK